MVKSLFWIILFSATVHPNRNESGSRPSSKTPKSSVWLATLGGIAAGSGGNIITGATVVIHHHTPPQAADVLMSAAVPLQFDFYTKLPKMAVDSPAPPPADVSAHLKNSPTASGVPTKSGKSANRNFGQTLISSHSGNKESIC